MNRAGRSHVAWADARCAFCGRTWAAGRAEGVARPLTLSREDKAIACTYGSGCAAIRPDDVQKQGVHWRVRFEGHWYTLDALAALCGVYVALLRYRIVIRRWPVAYAVVPKRVSLRANDRAKYRRLLRRALRSATKEVRA